MMEISTSAITTAFAAGIISFLSPCVLPLVPGYVSYITGQSVARSTMPKALIMRFQATALSVCFALGFTTIFVILGASATALGQALVCADDPLHAPPPLSCESNNVAPAVPSLASAGRPPTA